MAIVGEATKRIYLIRGDDVRIVADAESQLLSEIRPTSEIDVVVFDAEEVIGTEVCTALTQMHMFVDCAAICVRQADRLSEEAVTAIIEFLVDKGHGATLGNYLIVSSVGGRLSQRLAKVLLGLGVGVDLKLGNDSSRREFLANELSNSKLKFDSSAISKIERHLAEDIARIRGLLEVLEAAFDLGHRISEADLEPYLSRPGLQPLYLLTNAIETCRHGGEAQVVDQVRKFTQELQIHPLVLLSVVTRRLIDLASVSTPTIRTADQANDRLEELGLKRRAPFAAKKLLESAQVLDYQSVVKALGWCAEAEGRIKGLDSVPDYFALELLVARLCNLFYRMRAKSAARTDTQVS